MGDGVDGLGRFEGILVKAAMVFVENMTSETGTQE
jgi:hypothetical protein